MNEFLKSSIKALTEHAKRIMAGSYKNVDSIITYTDKSKYPDEINELAETFAMMSVKVEAREFQLEQTIDELKQNIKIRNEAGQLIIWFSIGIGIYIFILSFLQLPGIEQNFKPHFVRWFGLIFTIGQLFLMGFLILRGNLSLAQYGLTLRNAKRSIIESLFITAIIVLFLILLKIWLINNVDQFSNEKIFKPEDIDLFFWTYIFVAPLQEFIVRGVLQSSIERIIVSKYKVFFSIVATSFLFSALHTTYSFYFALITLMMSFLWCWMFARHRNLIGVSLNHVLTGHAFILLGFWEFIAF